MDFERHANDLVLCFLAEAGPATLAQVVVATELDGNVVTAALSNLRAKGKIDVEGHGRGAKWFAVLPAPASPSRRDKAMTEYEKRLGERAEMLQRAHARADAAEARLARAEALVQGFLDLDEMSSHGDGIRTEGCPACNLVVRARAFLAEQKGSNDGL